MRKKLILTIVTFLGFSWFGNAQNDTCLTNLNLGISFPPVADAAQRTFAKTHLDVLGVSKIRFAEDWSLREPTQGNFNWTSLDERINWAFNNNYELLLTIQSKAPAWACSPTQNVQSCVFNDNNDFQIYIDSLLQRYSGKISRIQFGNEWQSDFWYAGNAQEFIDANNVLFSSVQNYSPSTQVVLGGFTTISLRFLAGCNGVVSSFYDDDGTLFDANYLSTNCPLPLIQDVKNRIDSVLTFAQYDILDIHLYDDVEQWDEYYLNFSDTMSKPVIVSEFGGPNMHFEPYSEAYQSDRLFEYIKKLDSLQISDAYFFKLVEGTANPAHTTSGLIDDNTLVEKSAYYVFKSFMDCTSSVFEYNYGKEIRFYPNPLINHSTIEFENSSKTIKELMIYSSNGKIVRTIGGITNNYVILDKKDLTSGFYFIKIRDKNRVIARGRMIVN